MSDKTVSRILYCLGMISCILPAAIVIILEFPIWISRGNACLASGIALSGISIFLLTLAATPLLRLVKDKIRSPSVWMIWGTLTFILYAVHNVIDSLLLVSFAGFIGNLIGAILFFAGAKYEERAKE